MVRRLARAFSPEASIQGSPMLPSPDLLADRRVLTRKLSFWRTVAVGVAVLAVLGGALSWAGRRVGAPHVARIKISGLITGDDATLKLLRKVADSSSAKAALIVVESPGGTTAGSERLFKEIRRVAEKKPVVAVVGTMAASGGYLASLGADRIVAQETSIVGSIGVIAQNPNFSRTLDMLGVKVEEMKSAPLKASPNPYSPTTEEARAAMQALIDDSYAWFKRLVAERRGLSGEALAKVADGRVFTGRQGLDLKLIDELGDESTARKWLAEEKKISEDLPTQDWRPASDALSGLGMAHALAALAQAAGFERAAAALRSDGLEAAKLDGLLALWQGS
jgi:protease-4